MDFGGPSPGTGESKRGQYIGERRGSFYRKDMYPGFITL
jgi:hypothetical protein